MRCPSDEKLFIVVGICRTLLLQLVEKTSAKFPCFIELDDGKIYRKAMESRKPDQFHGKLTMVSGVDFPKKKTIHFSTLHRKSHVGGIH